MDAVRFLFGPASGINLLNGSNRHPHLRASEASRRSVHPSRRVFCRPYVCLNRPCVGHNNNQALCGHHSLLAGNHRTLQAFYRQPPSWGAETWAGDGHHIRHGEEAIWSGLGDKLDVHPYSVHPCNGRHGEVGRHGGNCRDQRAWWIKSAIVGTRRAIVTHSFIEGHTNGPATEILAIQFFNSAVGVFAGQIFEDAVYFQSATNCRLKCRTYP
jgi:hypothetical protein